MIHFAIVWLVLDAIVLAIGGVWLWFESRYPSHVHDEGDHDPYCPGCFADRMRR